MTNLNISYADVDQALGYTASRGSYTRQILKGKCRPSAEYQKRLTEWLATEPDLLHKIQTVAVPFLRARQGQKSPATYTRRRAQIALKRMAKHR